MKQQTAAAVSVFFCCAVSISSRGVRHRSSYKLLLRTTECFTRFCKPHDPPLYFAVCTMACAQHVDIGSAERACTSSSCASQEQFPKTVCTKCPRTLNVALPAVCPSDTTGTLPLRNIYTGAPSVFFEWHHLNSQFAKSQAADARAK